MERIKAYRYGNNLLLENPAGTGEPVLLECVPGVAVKRSGAGDLLVYRDGYAYGQTVKAALALGWCRCPEQE